MTGAPDVPVQSPIPVVVIEAGDHTVEVMLTIATLSLTVVTALTLAAMVHQDHELIKLLRSLVASLVPRRRTADGSELLPVAPLPDEPAV